MCASNVDDNHLHGIRHRAVALLAPRVAPHSGSSLTRTRSVYFPVPFPASIHHATNPIPYHNVEKRGLVAPRTISYTVNTRLRGLRWLLHAGPASIRCFRNSKLFLDRLRGLSSSEFTPSRKSDYAARHECVTQASPGLV
jgi:hypothetical protein